MESVTQDPLERRQPVEYMRRNMLVCKAYGAQSYIPGARKRLLAMKRPPKWLLKVLDEMDRRLEPLPAALAAYRDEADDRPTF